MAWSVKDINERATAAENTRKSMQPYIERTLQYAMPWRHPVASATAGERGRSVADGDRGADA